MTAPTYTATLEAPSRRSATPDLLWQDAWGNEQYVVRDSCGQTVIISRTARCAAAVMGIEQEELEWAIEHDGRCDVLEPTFAPIDRFGYPVPKDRGEFRAWVVPWAVLDVE